jgi:hypothetical protein
LGSLGCLEGGNLLLQPDGLFWIDPCHENWLDAAGRQKVQLHGHSQPSEIQAMEAVIWRISLEDVSQTRDNRDETHVLVAAFL